jgi:DNA-binding protein YbaB
VRHLKQTKISHPNISHFLHFLNSYMKKYIVIAVTVCMVQFAQAQSGEPWMVKSLTAEAIQNVHVETSGGSIKVTGAGNDARIEVFVSPGNSRNNNMDKEMMKKMLEEHYTLTVTTENHILTAIAKPNKGFRDWKKSLNISFSIVVPHQVSTDLTTSGGNITLSALSGKLDFVTSGGNLLVDHLGGVINGNTSGGNIIMAELQDDIKLTTSGGNIDATTSTGKITLSTSGGSLQLRHLKGNINATTSGGHVQGNTIEGMLVAHTSGGNVQLTDLACSIETSTSGGNIVVGIRQLGDYVRISNSGGSTELQVPAGKGMDIQLFAESVSAAAMDGFKGSIEKNRVTGSINGGGVPVTVHGGSKINFVVK